MKTIAAIFAWLGSNWNTLAILIVLVAGWFHLNIKFENGPPGSDPSITIVLPEKMPSVVKAAGPKGTSERIVDLVKAVAADPELLETAETAIKKVK